VISRNEHIKFDADLYIHLRAINQYTHTHTDDFNFMYQYKINIKDSEMKFTGSE
jgi:hypothetical protein